MKYIVDTKTQSAIGPILDLDKASPVVSVPFSEIIQNSATVASFETGLLPVSTSGLLSYRISHNYEQIIIQLEPGINSVKWGDCENDCDAPIYTLAMPYKVIIADFENGTFIGARHFFSMTPCYSWETQLYATPFSNTNNLGYHNTSIGWICLYPPNIPVVFKDLAEKIDYVVDRESGLAEPYNYENMDSTDGPVFYKTLMPDQSHFHDAQAWHNKTLTDGLEWVFDSSNFIPYYTLVSPEYFARAYVDPKSKGSTAYTLYHASYSNYSPYYDRQEEKPFNNPNVQANINAIVRLFSSNSNPPTRVNYSPSGKSSPVLKSPALSAKALEKKNILKGKCCDNCKKNFTGKTTWYKVFVDDNDHDLINAQDWCLHCTSDQAVSIEVDGKSYLYSKHTLMYFPELNLWCTLQQTTPCGWCASRYPIQGNPDSFFVYDIDNQKTRCKTCTDSYFIDPINNKMYLKNAGVLANVLKINSTPDKNIGLATEPTMIFSPHAEHICYCGLYIEDKASLIKIKKENETTEILVCKTCTNQNLISLDDITPVTVQQKETI